MSGRYILDLRQAIETTRHKLATFYNLLLEVALVDLHGCTPKLAHANDCENYKPLLDVQPVAMRIAALEIMRPSVG